jgi:cytochrome c oxidase subunit II
MSVQSALDPAGAHARTIWELFWYFVIPFAVIFTIVIVLAVLSVARKGRSADAGQLERDHTPSPETERRLGRVVGGATAFTVLALLVLIVASVSAGKAISTRPLSANPLVVEITASQWWWQVRYMNDDASRIVLTANEIHIPVGRAVLMRGTSIDVIHSFWVPNLQGKRDLIPSRVTTIWFQADQPGRYRGQCAEFCGLQHAHMALWVVAEPEDQFEQWMNHQLQPAVDPTDPDLLRGQQVFLHNACVLCHSIRGTTAGGQTAPDLTHIGSRISIAAGTLWNTKGNLGGWITDPENVKPGNHMATVSLKAEDLQPLLDYLESLQ